MSYLEIKDLDVHFGDLHVVKNIDLVVEKGQLVTFLGPSGCGKTTLMRTVAGLEKQSRGQIILDGKEVQDIPARMRNTGMVFQSYALFPNMTVYENVAFGLNLQKLDKQAVQKKVENILALVDLTARKDFYPSQLSGGQQQRVALARALIVEPKLLLLDEPLSALDAKIRKQIQIQLREIQRNLGITMIFVTHDQEEAMVLSDVVYVMKEGEIAQGASPRDVYAKPKSKFVAEFIGNYNHFSATELSMLLPFFQVEANTSYSLRPELIHLSSITDNDLHLEAQLQSIQILGNILRATFMAGEKEIVADFLNEKNVFQTLEQTKQLYISPEDFICHESEEAK